ncbi:MAG: PA0069 family radical SAM protein [Candidatus Binatia bacterium]
MSKPPLEGRGTRLNPPNRYEPLHIECDEADQESGAELEGGAPRTPTELYRDASKSALAENDSPDLAFRFSLNPYRGCEHGCIYCYARPSHEYLGFSAGLDFERKLLVKMDVAALLRETFASPRWTPQTVALSGNTDCYQPVERRLGLTRACLEVFAEFRNPVSIVTKSALVTRDVDLLGELARFGAARVYVSVTTLDNELARRMEPRAATPERRLQAISTLAAAGISVAVMTAPVIPGLNDHEIPAILQRAAEAGARSAAWTLLRLASPLDQLFRDWIERHYPDRAIRILGRIRECRAGNLNDTRFGRRMRGCGQYAAQIRDLFALAARRRGLDQPLPPLSADAFRRPPRAGDQLALL